MPEHGHHDRRQFTHTRRSASPSDHSSSQKRRHSRDRSNERLRDWDRDRRRVRDDSRSDHNRRRRSRDSRDSPARHMRRKRSLSRSVSPDPPRRRHKDDHAYSKQSRNTSRSPPPKRRRHDSRENRKRPSHHHSRPSKQSPPPHSPSPPPPPTRSKAPLPSQEAAYKGDPTSTPTTITTLPPEAEKQKPNYAPTGKLAAETNTVAHTSIILKYNEPPEARLPPPTSPYLLYIFKDSAIIETLKLHERSCWLFGRERAVVDHAIEHPSCSKQHAVLQFRFVEGKGEWGERKGRVKLYVIDLESANGTKVNGEGVPERRFMEVRSGDVIGFGESSREYVVIVPPKEGKGG